MPSALGAALAAGAPPLLAALIDRVFGEPRNAWHPVAGFGLLAQRLGRPLPEASPRAALWGGRAAWALLVGGTAALAWALQRGLQGTPALLAVPLTALALKPAMAWRMLRDEVAAVEAAQCRGLPAAQAQVRRLCSRDVTVLDAAGVRETGLETLAENLNDSWVAPLWWYAVAGLPGAWAWRAINTLDACWGYRGRWTWAGRCAARADDLGAWLPARLSALLLWPPGGGRWAVLRREARRTPSPNGGWPMGAMALALGVRLRKPGVYALNADAPSPTATDTGRGLQRAHRAAMAALGLATLAAALRGALLGGLGAELLPCCTVWPDRGVVP